MNSLEKNGRFEDFGWLGGCLEGLESVWSLENKVSWGWKWFYQEFEGYFESTLWRDWKVSSYIGVWAAWERKEPQRPEELEGRQKCLRHQFKVGWSCFTLGFHQKLFLVPWNNICFSYYTWCIQKEFQMTNLIIQCPTTKSPSLHT